uniref:Enhanced downy mildew isoform 1 n=1 Tax=Tetraselmis sp. GSL018 TaxID=582737 RepID=A0A061SIJ0_9CHLO
MRKNVGNTYHTRSSAVSEGGTLLLQDSNRQDEVIDLSQEEADCDGMEDDERANESVCTFCNNGGDLFLCDGVCLRSFCQEPDCLSRLGMPEELAAAALAETNVPFVCPNCAASRHPCFACGELGAAGADVVQCIRPDCGRFYHRRCLEERGAMVAADRAFACPLHRCAACGEEDDGGGGARGPMIPCQRCPTAFHRDCIPGELLEDPRPRVWTEEVDRPLLYCAAHEIPAGLQHAPLERPLFTEGMRSRWIRDLAREFKHLRACRAILKPQAGEAHSTAGGSAPPEAVGARCASEDTGVGHGQKRRAGSAAASGNSSGEGEAACGRRRRRLEQSRAPPHAVPVFGAPGEGRGVGDARCPPQRPRPSGAAEAVRAPAAIRKRPLAAPEETRAGAPPPIADGEEDPNNVSAEEAFEALSPMHETLQELFAGAEEQITFDSVERNIIKHKPYERAMRHRVMHRDRILQLQRLVDASKGSRKAAGLVSEGTLREVRQSLERVQVALEPWLHGARYTSYGRHFTSARHIRFVVEMMGMFVRSNDMVVDFSCGANEWAPMLRDHVRRLSEIRISVRAYDVVTPKNMESFLKRSWFDVKPGDLHQEREPERLIIGLNPPFGKGGQLAAEWVQHAASMRPRIIALIVPRKTQTPEGYKVLYANADIFQGETFYVPGGGMMTSWNRDPPVFSLLLRRDLAALQLPENYKDKIRAQEALSAPKLCC